MVGGGGTGPMGASKVVESAEHSAEIHDVAKFAVGEYNTKNGEALALKKVVSAKKQVVSGTMYHLTLELHKERIHAEDQKRKIYDARVWVKPWENDKKSLEHFKEAEPSASQ